MFRGLEFWGLSDETKDSPKANIYVRNLISWNDWNLSDFLGAVIGIQVLIWIFVALGTTGIHIPILRPVVGFVYCCFVPGIVLLRALNLHNLSSIDTLLYSTGLSIGIVYLVGFFISIGSPFLGITSPFSEIYLTTMISAVVIILCLVCCFQKNETPETPSKWHVPKILNVPNMSLLLVPFTAIFGTILVNAYQMNHLLLTMVIILASIIILVGQNRFFQNESYPIAIFVISITLLLHTALITPYLWGWDIVDENFYATGVLQQQAWDIGLYHVVNGCLSVVVLAPILSQLTELSLTWVFKLLYPLIFSLIAVALYQVYRHQVGDRIAFFACVMFVSYFQYYNGMIFLARQMIAEIFLVLLFLVVVSTAITRRKRVFLMGFFSISLITSHYGLSYLFMAALIAAWLLILLTDSRLTSKIRTWTLNRLGRNTSGLANFLHSKEERTILTAPFVVLFSLFTIGWYSLVSGGAAMYSLIQSANKIVNNIIIELANPAASQGMNTIVHETASPLHEVWKYLFLFMNLLIVIGILAYLFNRTSRHRFTREYLAFAFIFLALDIAGIAIPYLASALSVERFYQITIIVLSPFAIYGGLFIFSAAVKNFRSGLPGTAQACHVQAMLSILLVVFLIFNIGFIYEVTGDSPTSMALSTIDDFPKYNEREMTGAQWLHFHASVEDELRLLSDTKGQLLLRLNLADWSDMHAENVYTILKSPSTHVDPLFLHTVNIEEGVVHVTVIEKAIGSVRRLDVAEITSDRSKIYGNGGSEAYL